MTWRDEARPIIARVIATVGTSNRKQLKAALREAYPWGERAYHPYRIWCNEIRVQLGEIPGPGTRPRQKQESRSTKPAAASRGQQSQF
jgi:hypothetical protein